MAQTKIQDHEDLLNGNADARIEGIVPIVHRMVTEHETYRKVATFLNALILLAIAALSLMVHFHW